MAYYVTSSPTLDEVRDQFKGGTANMGGYYEGGSNVDSVYDSVDGYGNESIPSSGAISMSQFLGTGLHKVDSMNFTSGNVGDTWGRSITNSVGSGTTGMSSFGDSPAWNVNFCHWITAGYLYLGGLVSVTSAVNYANVGYGSFKGINIHWAGGNNTFVIDDSDYYGYETGAGWWYFAWGPGISNPFGNGFATTVYKLDAVNTSY